MKIRLLGRLLASFGCLLLGTGCATQEAGQRTSGQGLGPAAVAPPSQAANDAKAAQIPAKISIWIKLR